MKLQPVLVLDLDGTVRHHKADDPAGPFENFIHDADDVAVFDGAAATLRFYREQGYILAIATNQAGVAFGYSTRKQVVDAVNRTIGMLEAQAGMELFATAKISYCHPTAKRDDYQGRSLFRKPGTGMLASIEEDLRTVNVMPDWNNSLVVGDRTDDAEMAEAAGLEFRNAWSFFDRPMPEGAQEQLHRKSYNQTHEAKKAERDYWRELVLQATAQAGE